VGAAQGMMVQAAAGQTNDQSSTTMRTINKGCTLRATYTFMRLYFSC
jgi:hypothetical protein